MDMYTCMYFSRTKGNSCYVRTLFSNTESYLHEISDFTSSFNLTMFCSPGISHTKPDSSLSSRLMTLSFFLNHVWYWYVSFLQYTSEPLLSLQRQIDTNTLHWLGILPAFYKWIRRYCCTPGIGQVHYLIDTLSEAQKLQYSCCYWPWKLIEAVNI